MGAVTKTSHKNNCTATTWREFARPEAPWHATGKHRPHRGETPRVRQTRRARCLRPGTRRLRGALDGLLQPRLRYLPSHGNQVPVILRHQAAGCSSIAQTSCSPSSGPDRTTGMGSAHPQSPEGLGDVSEPPDAPECDPDADAHDHHNFFFPNHGASATSAAGFGWRGSDGRV